MHRPYGGKTMLKKLQVVVTLLCMFSYASAGTVSIGTASARGDMRVDNYMVRGNATLFDGSVVETGQATADLRLDKGTEITMSKSSRGTLYRDRLVLQWGESEWASNSFQLEANGIRVTPNEPNSRGVVSLKSGNTVEVAALNGSFGVTNDHGVLLASVRPGKPISLALQAGGNPAPLGYQFSGTGIISFENGHYYLTTDENVKYEVTGRDFKQYVGMKVQVSGTLLVSNTQAGGGTLAKLEVVQINSISVNGPGGMSKKDKLIIGGAIIGAGAGIGVGVYEYNHPLSSASR